MAIGEILSIRCCPSKTVGTSTALTLEIAEQDPSEVRRTDQPGYQVEIVFVSRNA
jgi:hypothetical protein